MHRCVAIQICTVVCCCSHAPALLQDATTGLYCALATLPNYTSPGLVCNQTSAAAATQLQYTATGLETADGTPLSSSAPGEPLLKDGSASPVDADAQINLGAAPGFTNPPVAAGMQVSIYAGGASAGLPLSTSTSSGSLPAGTVMQSSTPTAFNIISTNGSDPATPQPPSTVVLQDASTGLYCKLYPLGAPINLDGLVCNVTTAAGASPLEYTSTGFTAGGVPLSSAGPGQPLVVDPSVSAASRSAQLQVARSTIQNPVLPANSTDVLYPGGAGSTTPVIVSDGSDGLPAGTLVLGDAGDAPAPFNFISLNGSTVMAPGNTTVIMQVCVQSVTWAPDHSADVTMLLSLLM